MPAIIASAYVAAAVTFLACDALWLGWIAKSFYVEALGALTRERPHFGVALIFYAIYAAGIVVLAVMPALEHSPLRAMLLGALLGLCAYAAYDLSNLATLRDFPARLALVDLAWGTFVTAISALAGFCAARWVAG